MLRLEKTLRDERDDLNITSKFADVDVIFFNRVPKVGSQSIMSLMKLLAKRNNFTWMKDSDANIQVSSQC